MVQAPKVITSLASYTSSPDVLVIPISNSAVALALAGSLCDIPFLCPSLGAATS